MLRKGKIGIVTLFGYHNYGNRLQMYAVQKVYKDLRSESEIIKYRLKGPKDPIVIQIKVFIMYVLFLRKNLKAYFLNNKRTYRFKKHAKKNYTESKQYVNLLKIQPDFSSKYSFFSVGSDQVWGWFVYPIAQFVFLKFAPKEKRISFSPSFGSAMINEQYRALFSEGLEGFTHISVREESGADIVKNLTGKDATVLCDPTMCLRKDEWLSFSRKHKMKPKHQFILTYFLGEPSAKVSETLKIFASEYEIVRLNSLEHPKFYAVDPSEWVDYVNSASLILTDSFHGVVFSLILQTPFAVYSRKGGEDMETRVNHILKSFQMEGRLEVSALDPALFTQDFSAVENLIREEKRKTYHFLELSLEK